MEIDGFLIPMIVAILSSGLFAGGILYVLYVLEKKSKEKHKRIN